jgi:nitroimidazol reductase NimA-like FMN-containing flavoprotein (pyridoxamine 5'-phosphate oxidase superfamily)
MVHARLGDSVVLHGSPAAGLLRDARGGSAVCLTATLLDGLVLARSARRHSVNYRSVTVHGRAAQVTDPEEFVAGMRALIEHFVPGRWEQVRKAVPDDMRDTALWRVTIEDASVKARSGSTVEPDTDLGLPVWAGEVPARLVFGQPVPAVGVPAAIAAGPVTVNRMLSAAP